MCVDYRQLNTRTRPGRFPISNMKEILEDLQGCSYFTTSDLSSGYWQIPVADECKNRTTFTCQFGTYRFEVIPFDLMNAPATFQRMMNKTSKELQFCRVYLGDILIFSNSGDQNIIEVVTKESEQRVFG